MECILNDTRIKYEDGKLYSYVKRYPSKVFKWYHLKGSFDGRYIKLVIKYKKYYYHRAIYKLHNPEWDITDNSKNNVIDHLDGNKLNNNIENLQNKTHQQNDWNNLNVKGYSWCKKNNKYHAKITANYKSIHLGYFDNEIDAHNAYLEAKKIYHITPTI
tara:strand:+ start:764 stop:1240 length:477 start_codon:yes stop_codon:yes gene_type:complete